MFSRCLFRSVFYRTSRTTPKPHSDCRDVHAFYKLEQERKDIKHILDYYVWSLKGGVVTALAFCVGVYYVFIRSAKLREQFEVKYLTQLPPKDFPAEDYDYKYWELILTRPTSASKVLTTDQAAKDHYVLLYHAELAGGHIPMQRFARLQKYISLRKDLPIKSVFVGMDKSLDPNALQDYCDQYSKDVIACYPASEEVREELGKVFSNIGCIYLIERGTGNVIYIIDPNKHPLEAIATRMIYTISKNMDFRVSKEIVDKGINVKLGHDEELRQKAPTY
jgi:hypothetical protein